MRISVKCIGLHLILWAVLGLGMTPNAAAQAASLDTLETRLDALFEQIKKAEGQREMKKAFEHHLEALQIEQQLPPKQEKRERLYWEFSSFLSQLDANNLAIIYVKKGLKEALLLHPNEIDSHLKYYGRLGAYYMNLNMRDSAELYFRKSLQALQKVSPNSVSLMGTYNNIGVFFHHFEQRDSAKHYYLLAKSFAVGRNKEFGIYFAILGNLIDIQKEMGDLPGALQSYHLLEQKIRTAIENGSLVQPRLVQVMLNQIETKLLMGKSKGQEFALAAAFQELQQVSNYLLSPRHFRYMRLKEQYYELEGQCKLAYEQRGYIMTMKDSLHTQNINVGHTVQEFLTSMQLSSYEKELQIQEALAATEREKARNTRLVSLFVVLACLAGIAGLLTHFRRRAILQAKEVEMETIKRKLLDTELKNKKLESEALKTKISQKENDLLDFSTYFANYRKWMDKLVLELETIRRKPTEKNKINEVISELNTHLLVDEKVRLIHENIDTLNQEFFEKLTSRFPDLTPKEKEFCGLIRLNFTSKEIALYRNVTLKSVKMVRYRLRKKLGIDAKVDIFSFIKGI